MAGGDTRQRPPHRRLRQVAARRHSALIVVSPAMPRAVTPIMATALRLVVGVTSMARIVGGAMLHDDRGERGDDNRRRIIMDGGRGGYDIGAVMVAADSRTRSRAQGTADQSAAPPTDAVAHHRAGAAADGRTQNRLTRRGRIGEHQACRDQSRGDSKFPVHYNLHQVTVTSD